MNRQQKELLHYQNTHKEIDGVIHKKCSICEDWLPDNLDNF